MCGKNSYWHKWETSVRGSPPRVREKPLDIHTSFNRYRITPACAGKTNQRTERRLEKRDHPRVCGKNPNNESDNVTLWGSPPRVREKHKLAVHDEAHLGITPACAGKTTFSVVLVCLTRDHPRVCGKN